MSKAAGKNLQSVMNLNSLINSVSCFLFVYSSSKKEVWTSHSSIVQEILDILTFLLCFFSEGNNFFKAKSYEQAIEKYTEAIALDPSDVTFYSNRSACYAALGKWTEAAEDGRQCIVTDKSFVKGYFRAALAHQALGNLEAASEAVKRGLGIDSTSADLKRMSKEIDESSRMKKVDAMIAQAEKQLASSDVTGAYKPLDNALRLDPTNSMLNRMMDKVRPKFEMAEKHRMASLDPKERLKEEGDTLFKAANFEGAIKAYTKCLDSISDKVL